MEKYCPTEILSHVKATCKFHRILELSKTTNQEWRAISMKVEQDQTMNCEQWSWVQLLNFRIRKKRFGSSGTAAASLRKLIDRILNIVEDLNIQIHCFRKKGKMNIIQDSLFNPATSGDFSPKEEILQQSLMILMIKPTEDMNANRRNKKIKRYGCLLHDNQAMAQYYHSIPWCYQLTYHHPPNPLIQSTINKDIREMITAVLEKAQTSQKIGRRMRKLSKHLPPRKMMITVIDEREENPYSNELFNKKNQIMMPFKEQLIVDIMHGEDID
ncbi:MAG: hypothetical protein EZS28_032092 [Streblomastix strix]|uniref:Uncharacterized protein n=1 Tax=Streblomastix strix TaxID=222440 RepID=A0A5J4UQS9_9EUKA|nr:MAG: hypothetical protein EZS28_032092 [Streblomastix strix]